MQHRSIVFSNLIAVLDFEALDTIYIISLSLSNNNNITHTIVERGRRERERE